MIDDKQLLRAFMQEIKALEQEHRVIRKGWDKKYDVHNRKGN